jgi:hypothetical protein
MGNINYRINEFGEIIRDTQNIPNVPRRKRLPTDRGFWLTLVLSIVTLGIYQCYLIHAFAKETNIAASLEDGRHTKGFWLFFLLSLITLGIYSIVWAVNLIDRRCKYLSQHGQPEGLQVSTYLLTVFLWSWLTLGIMTIVVSCKFLYQQNAVNRTCNEIYRLF